MGQKNTTILEPSDPSGNPETRITQPTPDTKGQREGGEGSPKHRTEFGLRNPYLL